METKKAFSCLNEICDESCVIRFFCPDFQQASSEHLNARPYVQWIHYESLHLLLGMEIPDGFSKSYTKRKKSQHELGCSDELA